MKSIDWDEPQKFSVAKLLNVVDPFDVWSGERISEESVALCIKRKDFLASAYSEAYRVTLPCWTESEHARRIAYLASHGWDAPIYIDVGVPGFGTRSCNPVADGHHRLAAAKMRGDRWILGKGSGAIRELEAFLYDGKE